MTDPWLTLTAIAMAVVWLFGPGLAVGVVAGLRGFAAAALAPALSLAVLGAGGLLAPLAHLRWGVGTALIACVLAVAIAFVITRFLPIRAARVLPQWKPRWRLGVMLATAAAAVLGFTLAFLGTGGARAMPQYHDSVFHANLVRYIIQTGDASPLHAGRLDHPGTDISYYPSAVHGLVALLPPSTQVWPALNMVWLVAGTAVWTLGLVYLARIVFPRRPGLTAAAAALAVLFESNPTSLVWLVPNAVGLSVLPALLGWSVQLARVVRLKAVGRVTRTLILAAGVIGAGFAHPNCVFSYLVLASPVALFIAATFATRAWRRGLRALTVGALAVVVAVIAAAVIAVFAVPRVRDLVEAPGWEVPHSVALALAGGLFDATGVFAWGPNLLAFATIVTGVIVVLRDRRQRWLVVSFGLSLALYLAAATQWGPLSWLTGLWYSDRTRLGPVLTVAAVPLALVGVDWACRTVLGRLLGPVAPTATAPTSQGTRDDAVPTEVPASAASAAVTEQTMDDDGPRVGPASAAQRTAQRRWVRPVCAVASVIALVGGVTLVAMRPGRYAEQGYALV
ncbi:MAG: hypothetical protein LBM66_04455, partial [Bifidobacteriaceae bacterium]|nr:hypothetical protein [Bifidobacteriaceae bacterium]